MKPLNLDNKPCNPVSSNCVVWQGPTLECIDLCKGDTVSDVVGAGVGACVGALVGAFVGAFVGA